jgi:hypothetical protein
VRRALAALGAAGALLLTGCEPGTFVIPAKGRETFTVSLDRQGGSGGTSSVKAALGLRMPSITKPARPGGYTFKGYYSETDGGGTQYYTASGASAREWDIASDTTLYAMWKDDRTAVSLLDLTGAVTAPVKDAAPDTTAIDTAQYTGTVAWHYAGGAAFTGNAFAASTVYKAIVTLTAKSGYTFTGVAANSFTCTGATSVTNAADSGTVTITFPATAAITATTANLASVLAGLAANTAGTPYTISLAEGTSISDNWTTINTAVTGRYVVLDLSACSAADNTVTGAYSPSGNAFNIIKDNAYITGVILPDTLTSIGDYAFYQCVSLTSVTIPASVTSIGAGAFWGCTSLTSVTIPASVTSIGASAFRDCSSLTSVTIPAGVTSIGNNAFNGCSNLTSVTFAGSAAVVDSNAFPNGDSLLTAGGATAGGTAMAAGTYTLSGETWTKR